MFTGIIEEVGTVAKIESSKKGKTFNVKTSKILSNKKIGGSIAINGACMTITKIENEIFSFDAMNESLEKTNISELTEGSEVNLEGALTLEKPLEGHMVQGHVDATGTVIRLETEEDTILEISFPEELEKYMALKGSITINGVSLTISHLKAKTLEVKLIPHTIENTNLGKLKKGDKVNLEIDIIARYLDRLMQDKANQTTYEFLKERNLI